MSTATIVYRTADGFQFDSEKAAAAHENLAAKAAAAMAPLGGPLPQAVEDGKGWVQHSQSAYQRAHRALCKLTAPHVKSWDKLYDACLNAPDTIHLMGVIGRIMSDSRGPLSDAWHRLAFIDSSYREHQQPYYAINGPREGQVCVEDRR
jgi:hypothetical protein